MRFTANTTPVTRTQLEHVIRAAGAIAGSRELVVIGSQALLAAVPDAAGILAQSMEVDLYPADNPAKADLVDSCIGELSLFHETYGYYAHGVGPQTAILPDRWRLRARIVESAQTDGVRAICLHPIDLAISKLAAGRERDLTFVTAMLQKSCVTVPEIEAALTELPEAAATRVRQMLPGLRS